MTSLDAVRELALSLPRTTEALVRDRVKFRVGLDAIDDDEMRELVQDAWRMVVPKRLAAEVLGD